MPGIVHELVSIANAVLSQISTGCHAAPVLWRQWGDPAQTDFHDNVPRQSLPTPVTIIVESITRAAPWRNCCHEFSFHFPVQESCLPVIPVLIVVMVDDCFASQRAMDTRFHNGISIVFSQKISRIFLCRCFRVSIFLSLLLMPGICREGKRFSAYDELQVERTVALKIKAGTIDFMAAFITHPWWSCRLPEQDRNCLISPLLVASRNRLNSSTIFIGEFLS